jgi:hypothetical protein
MPGAFTLSGAQAGTTIDAAPGGISSIKCTAVPTPTSYTVPSHDHAVGAKSYGLPKVGAFCIVDQGVTPWKVLMNVEQSNLVNAFPLNKTVNFATGFRPTYTTLYLQSCPVGASFTLISV